MNDERPLTVDDFESFEIGPYWFTVSDNYKDVAMLRCKGTRNSDHSYDYDQEFPVGSNLKEIKRHASLWFERQCYEWISEAEKAR